ncbi:hypothetical protein V498_05814 [Pseudogymnoascus sp. VKM F-4517 (FW-2822)]|nr:hypothetical protein V498_05814 [Pseudogymnoascus sp. VKM F-4517 (FW-2822)]
MAGEIPHKKADFQVMSDLHLEVSNEYSTFLIPNAAPFLILAGDIGRLADYESFLVFIRAQCRQFTRVFLVLGNHEFYGLSRSEGIRRAESLEREPDLFGILTVLNRTRVTLEDYSVTILGCTLNSLITPEAEEIVKGRVKDFQRIKNWSVASHNKEHSLDVAWLENQIKHIRANENTSGHKILVVTHHAPSVQESSSPLHIGNPWGSAFATDLLGNGGKPALSDVQWWIFGHTHFCTEFSKANVRVISNQRGYVLPKVTKNQAPESIFQPIVQKAELVTTNKRSTFQVNKVIRRDPFCHIPHSTNFAACSASAHQASAIKEGQQDREGKESEHTATKPSHFTTAATSASNSTTVAARAEKKFSPQYSLWMTGLQ